MPLTTRRSAFPVASASSSIVYTGFWCASELCTTVPPFSSLRLLGPDSVRAGPVHVYRDDVLVFSDTREEQRMVHARMVLETLRHHSLGSAAPPSRVASSASGCGQLRELRPELLPKRRRRCLSGWGAAPVTAGPLGDIMIQAVPQPFTLIIRLEAPPPGLPGGRREPRRRGLGFQADNKGELQAEAPPPGLPGGFSAWMFGSKPHKARFPPRSPPSRLSSA